jgi:hypothetical protein
MSISSMSRSNAFRTARKAGVDEGEQVKEEMKE